MSLFSTLKKNAKHALRDHWLSAIVVTLIPGLTSTLLTFFVGSGIGLLAQRFPAFQQGQGASSGELMGLMPEGMFLVLAVSLLFSVMILLVLIPLQLGCTHWYFQLVQGNPQPVSNIFYFFEDFKRYRRSLWLYINQGFRRGFWAAVFHCIPAGLLSGIFFLAVQHRDAVQTTPQLGWLLVMGMLLMSLVFFLVILLYAAYMNKYFLADYLVVSDDEIKPGDAIKRSIEYTKGYRFNLLWFILSFIGWLLLASILPTLFYSVPYLNASMALYALYLMETKKREQPVLQEFPPGNGEAAKPEIAKPPSPRKEPKNNHPIGSVWGSDTEFAKNQDGFRITEEHISSRKEEPEVSSEPPAVVPKESSEERKEENQSPPEGTYPGL